MNRTLSSSEATSKFKEYKSKVAGEGVIVSNREARVIAQEVCGTPVEWDWDLPRTKEGYYHYKGGMAVSFPFFCFFLSFSLAFLTY